MRRHGVRHGMDIRTVIAMAALVVAPRLAAQEVTGTGPALIGVDRIVAIVGKTPILWSEVGSWIAERRASGLRMPPDSAGQIALARRAVEELVNEELLVQMAEKEKVEVNETEVTAAADRQVRRLREEIPDELRYREELRRAGFASPEDYRKWLGEEARRSFLIQKLLDKLRQEGKLVAGAVSEDEVSRMFEENRATLPNRPATISFRQIVIAPEASAKAKAAARAKAESLAVEIRGGAEFEAVARRESMDQTTAQTGGDLGWNRRGLMVRAFDDMMFGLGPGQISPVVETPFGFHIIKVERVQPAEVKARHILIRPAIDSGDIARAQARADTVARRWREGASFDSLASKYNDPREATIIGDPQEREKLPPSYLAAFEGKSDGDVTDPFRIEDPTSGHPKFVVAQVTRAQEGGAYTVEDLRESIRSQLVQEKAMQRLIASLRRTSYVSIRI